MNKSRSLETNKKGFRPIIFLLTYFRREYVVVFSSDCHIAFLIRSPNRTLHSQPMGS